ncbi:DNA polymerase IV [Dermatophilus congolensis]|uniref:DNA polymerase IV n=1 Tax=Dermatophilus congolensis TaxID=1863 RepID=UPI001AAF79A5|nr:DNA polymerase IV [Dermatophilus congolensis]MBO3152005.1 DNA polymerase IV [Dermatophilus congolensis]MBO3160986.1 DNA polymerase IV [Dermatophilus congolensis]MBO3163290.1 DNA polymerase IV [Dermatophilus congolensis]MBO3176847.1 DNA polymerase IV [Dermatophilus congolensis]
MSRRRFPVPARHSHNPVDDTGCVILHVDMDAFYASVTLLDHPHLIGKPVIIGGGTRGVVLSATYEARAFGVASAMPMSRAVRLCPQAVVLPPQHERYRAVSAAVMETFATVTPVIEPLSLDEAFLDVSGAVRRLGSPAVIAEQIRAAIFAEQGITCSVGVASTKFVAKIASGMAKPDGMLVVPAAEMVEFVQQLPVGALWGVGDKTEEHLHRLGLRYVSDIATTSVSTLRHALGATGEHLYAMAWGIDPRVVTPERVEKSIGADQTFEHDIDDVAELQRRLLAMCEKTAARARAAGMVGRTITLRVRFSDFTTVTRSVTVQEHTDVGREIFLQARGLFDNLGVQGMRVRLVGVRLEGLVRRAEVAVQRDLFAPEQGWREAEVAVDAASARFGQGIVRPASLLKRDLGEDGMRLRE